MCTKIRNREQVGFMRFIINTVAVLSVVTGAALLFTLGFHDVPVAPDDAISGGVDLTGAVTALISAALVFFFFLFSRKIISRCASR